MDATFWVNIAIIILFHSDSIIMLSKRFQTFIFNEIIAILLFFSFVLSPILILEFTYFLKPINTLVRIYQILLIF